jgi:hypothetical protein
MGGPLGVLALEFLPYNESLHAGMCGTAMPAYLQRVHRTIDRAPQRNTILIASPSVSMDSRRRICGKGTY